MPNRTLSQTPNRTLSQTPSQTPNPGAKPEAGGQAVNPAGWMRTHRVSAASLLLLLVIGGLVAASRLPVALFPNVAFPRLLVNVDAGDRPADQMVMEVTTPVEQAIRSVPGVRTVRSTSSRGGSDISINFDWGTGHGVGDAPWSSRP